MRFVTIEEAVASCSTIIKDCSREDRVLFKTWIWIAEKQIGMLNSNIKTDNISFINLSARKPSDHLSTIDISLIDNLGNDIRYRYKGQKGKRIHNRSSVNSPRMIDIYEDETSFHIDSTGLDIDSASIRYWAYPVDNNGMIKIPEDHLYAIMIFVDYMYSIRENKSFNKILETKNEWKKQASKARGKNSLPSIAEGREILNSWMSLIPKGVSTKYNTY